MTFKKINKIQTIPQSNRFAPKIIFKLYNSYRLQLSFSVKSLSIAIHNRIIDIDLHLHTLKVRRFAENLALHLCAAFK
jgi:hypothetical protein